MNDPYQILGVSPSATDEEIKQAYRTLAKKYHPDNYAGSPLADLASEKMSQINSAYDTIQERRKSASQGGYYSQPSAGGNNYQGSGQFSDIRRLINAGRIFDAEQLLDGTPAASRDAEWHFLKGNVLLARGFLEDGFTYLQRACMMDPQNYEYRAAFERISAQRQFGYGGRTGGYSYSTCDPCSLCTTLICANCLCNCCRCSCV